MLQILHIENVAVIEKADIEFEPGLNVMTGETGAGKSIVIDALGAVLGRRTSRELIRTGADSAVVTASFSGVDAAAWCDDNGIPFEEDELFLMRKMSAEGKNNCRINGSPVSVQQLKELGDMLLNIHGQNDGLHLLDERSHLAYLDSFGEIQEDIAEYKKFYEKYREVLSETKALSLDESEKERRIDTLKYQIKELKDADIKPGEQESLIARRDLMRNSEKLLDGLNTAFYAVYGGDRSGGAIELLRDADGALASVSRYAEELGTISDKLREISYSAEDIAEELRDFKSKLDFSPGELDEIESRVSLLRRLGKKYGGSEEEMLSYLENCENELENIEYADEKLRKLEKELAECKSAAEKAADRLSQKRRAAASVLETRIKDELGQLSMAGVQFVINFTPKENGFDATGCDEVKFLMSANAGEEPGRISKIASGGELARIMLAMKNVLAENDDIQTMVFDEVDTGVSGIAAQRVGEKLAALARNKQVICITHLPQIAVMADTHFEILKQQENGRTHTKIIPLDEDGRVEELSRIFGGENITATTRESVRDQLAAAESFKKTL